MEWTDTKNFLNKIVEEEKERFARQENKLIVTIPLVVRPAIVVVEPRLAIVTIDIEQLQVAVAVGNLYKIPSMPPPLENSIIISRLNII